MRLQIDNACWLGEDGWFHFGTMCLDGGRIAKLESGRAKTSFLNRSPDDGPQSVLAAVTDDPLTSSLALSLLGGTLVVGGASTVRRRRRLPGRQASDATTLPEQETR